MGTDYTQYMGAGLFCVFKMWKGMASNLFSAKQWMSGSMMEW
jgi:hypothetical protein